MSTRHSVAVVAVAVVLSSVLLRVFAPGYWSALGFPLDDAWIHAVYGRSLARSASLAYNPGVATTGETAPAWAFVVALPHLLFRDPRRVVMAVKVVGFALHAATALLLLRATRDRRTPMHVAGAAAFALHPDLVAASVSGMEVPLATLAVAWLLVELLSGSTLRIAAAAFLAPLARPELACVGPLLVAGLAVESRTRPRRPAVLGVFGGTLAAFLVVGARNALVSGRPLPSTFYAKVKSSAVSVLDAQSLGFSGLLGHVALLDSLLVVVALTGVALYVLVWRREDDVPLAPTLLLTGVAYCAVSFALIAPIDAIAFYHQRYVLPGVALIVFALPGLVDALIVRIATEKQVVPARLGIAVVVAGLLLLATPGRHRHLASDARNIDDVQVQEGRALAHAREGEVVWAIDAGAIRYFGNATVVDMMGLNTPEVLGPSGDAFLASHSPRYLETVPTWSSVDPPSLLSAMTVTTHRPSTPYTVTSFRAMAERSLARCAAPVEGTFVVRTRRHRFACAP